MTIEFQLLPGAQFAPQASAILTAAWSAPALHYTPEYLHWQMSFPGPAEAPAVAAFVDSSPAGFAGSTHRRLRYGPEIVDVLLVSFVAVHPDFRNRGIAAGLYRTLLAAIAAARLPVITFAQAGSAGQKALERAYVNAGFELRSLGSYPAFACAPRAVQETQWTPQASTPALGESVARAVDACAADRSLLWSAPSDVQWLHYLEDPRPRSLLSLQSRDGEAAAAWMVQTAYVSAQGVNSVATIDCAWLNRARPELLSGLASAVAGLSPAVTTMVNAPSLAGFDPKLLRQAGFRQVGPGFQGYCATAAGSVPLPPAAAVNCEIV